MLRWTLALLVMTAAPAFASDEDVAKGLQNLANMQQLAQAAELSLLTAVAPEAMVDPWGTPYRVTIGGSYVIVGAGSDGKFDEASWKSEGQFAGLEGDVRMVDGKLTRSNRNWLYPQITDTTRAALDNLVRAEVHLMMARNPTMRALEARRVTAAIIENGGKADAWGTPLRVTPGRVVSAGADRKFDEASWDKPPAASVDEDIVYEKGAFTRPIDEQAVIRAAQPRAVPIPQPLDPPSNRDWPQIAPPIKAPVVVTQVEPVYPDIYRRARIEGIVILETAISDTGRIDDVRVIKSLAPEIDMAAVTAARQWTFQPATKDEKPVSVKFNLTINFKLK